MVFALNVSFGKGRQNNLGFLSFHPPSCNKLINMHTDLKIQHCNFDALALGSGAEHCDQRLSQWSSGLHWKVKLIVFVAYA